MKSISQKLQDDIRAIMDSTVNEALIGKQANIDVNKNGRIDGQDFVKLRSMKKTPAGKVHNCATHVEHAVFGKGTTVSEQHAEPDENGNIAWYTIQFEHSTQQVLTKDLTITMSEAHVHESAEEQVDEAANRAQQAAIAISLIKAGKKDGKMPKPMKEESHQSATTMKHIPNASPALKKAAKDIKPGIAGYRDRVAMLKAGGVKEEIQIDERDEGKPGLMFKKFAAKAAAKYGSVEAGNRVAGAIRKKVLAKEGVEVTEEEIDAMFEGLKDSYTFVEYLDEARAQFGDEEAVSIANDMFNKQDITLFIK